MLASHPLLGVTYVVRGFREIVRPGIRRFALTPVAINTLVFGAAIFVAARFYGAWMSALLPSGDAGWVAAVTGLLWVVFSVATLFLLFFAFTVVANLIGAPFNGPLAEVVERRATGAPGGGSQGNTPGLLREIPHALMNELRKLIFFCAYGLPLLLLFLVPVVQIAAPFIWGLFVAWMFALEYGDYPMANHGIRFQEVRHRMGREVILTLGFGGTVVVAMLIPVLNLFVMPAAVAGATLMWVEKLKGVNGSSHNTPTGA